MLFDWFTVGAQALNFLVLVWLMKRFLYKPILDAIDAREKRIALALLDAALKQTAAQKERDEFHSKNAKFDQQRNELLSQVKDKIKAERQRLLDQAHQAADALRAKRQDALTSELQSLQRNIVRRSREEVFAIANKVLTDLAGTPLEQRMAEVFTRRLRALHGKAKETLGAALKTAPEPAVVRSAFVLSADERAKIQNVINETFSVDIHLQFETAPDLVGGIELTANGQKVAWSITDYLTALKTGVGELLKEQDKPELKAKPKIKAKPKPKTHAKAEPEPEPVVKAAPKPKAEVKVEPKAAAPTKTHMSL